MSAATAAAASGGPIRLKVRRLNGPDIVLQILPDAAVSQLKTILASQTQVSEGRQRLIYRGKVLVDTNTLAQHDIADDHTVHMVSRPADAPPANASAAAASGSNRGQAAARATAATGMQRPATRNASLAEMMGYNLPSRVSPVHIPLTAISVAVAAAAAPAAAGSPAGPGPFAPYAAPPPAPLPGSWALGPRLSQAQAGAGRSFPRDFPPTVRVPPADQTSRLQQQQQQQQQQWGIPDYFGAAGAA
eukprot:13726-Heterococcus_DN1.PRE.4